MAFVDTKGKKKTWTGLYTRVATKLKIAIQYTLRAFPPEWASARPASDRPASYHPQNLKQYIFLLEGAKGSVFCINTDLYL